MRIIIIAVIIALLLLICTFTLCACRVAGLADEQTESLKKNLSKNHKKGN